MSLRPRYSLLTLLVLTALVAGGVKLWYGPHHVVEERAPGKQFEYTYTRGWNGEKLVNGVCILRMREPNGPAVFISAAYFINGKKLPCYYVLFKLTKDSSPLLEPPVYDLELIKQLPLSPSEQLTFRQAIEAEQGIKTQDLESGLSWYELFAGPPTDPYVNGKANDFSVWVDNYHYELKRPWSDFIQ